MGRGHSQPGPDGGIGPVAAGLTRRRASTLVLAASLCGMAGRARAEQPVAIVIGYSAGGTTDTIARVLAPKLGENLHKTVIVDNKPGAAAQIASRHVAKSAPDGQTLQLATQTSHAAGQRLYARVGYDPVADFTPIALVAQTPLVLVVNRNALPVTTLAELIAYLRERPGQVNYATGGHGDGAHLAGVFFNREAGVSAVPVPYQGDGAAMPALLGGHVPFMFVSAPTAMAGLSTGLLRALAVTGKAGYAALPDVPTMAESGLTGFEIVLWWGMFGPAAMAPPLVTKLNSAINAVLSEPDTRKRLGELGYEIIGTSADHFREFVAAENRRWETVLRDQKLTAQSRD